MAFPEDLARHADQIRGRRAHVKGEESTKQALVVPFLQVLGYDVFDPREVKPEYVADFAIKKMGQFEKVDYAVFVADQPALFFECKSIGAVLEDHGGQLSRYFNATPSVRVGIITDGIRVRVFTDLQQPNVMDPTPWLDINLLELKPAEIDALRRFRKSDFSASDAVALAEEMVFYNAMVDVVAVQFREPTDSFLRWVAGEIPAVGRVTTKVLDRLNPILRKAMQSVIVEQVTRSFERSAETPPSAPPPPPVPAAPSGPTPEDSSGIVTTAEELEAYRLIESYIREAHPNAPIAYRDSKSYFTVHQSNLRKWFARLCLDHKPAWFALRHVKPEDARRLAPGVEVADGGGHGDSRFVLSSVSDLAKLRTVIIASYDQEAARVQDDKADPHSG